MGTIILTAITSATLVVSVINLGMTTAVYDRIVEGYEDRAQRRKEKREEKDAKAKKKEPSVKAVA